MRETKRLTLHVRCEFPDDNGVCAEDRRGVKHGWGSRIFGWHIRCVDSRQRNDDRHCADDRGGRHESNLGIEGRKILPTRRGQSTRVEERETALPADGAEANLTLRPERDRLSEIRLETYTVADGARLGMRVPAHAHRTAWYNVGTLRGAGSFR